MVTPEDPRPEFTEDHALWSQLLQQAAEMDEDVFLALHCIRCGGARLGYEEGNLKFQPRFIDPAGNPDRGTAWETREDFRLDCDDILGPHASQIESLLESLENEASPNVATS